MRTVHKLILSSCMLAFVGFGSSLVRAHSNGHESRTISDCQKLPGSAREGERAGCLACIGRNSSKAKFHYHPDYPAGDRCRPDDGKP